MKPGEWFWVDKDILRTYSALVGASAILVYVFLASMADEHQSCYPSQRYIADHLGCSRATVNRGIKKLEINKLVVIVRKERINNHYTLLQAGSNCAETQVSHHRNELVSKLDTNNTNKQEINNNIVVSVKKEDLFAQDIADFLNDQTHIETYKKYVQQYPESFLRKIISEVKLTPLHKIKKSRHALFTYLIHYYANKNK